MNLDDLELLAKSTKEDLPEPWTMGKPGSYTGWYPCFLGDIRHPACDHIAAWSPDVALRFVALARAARTYAAPAGDDWINRQALIAAVAALEKP